MNWKKLLLMCISTVAFAIGRSSFATEFPIGAEYGAKTPEDAATSAYKGAEKRIEFGNFRVEYQATGKAKSLKAARKACANLGDGRTWALPTATEFWATLMSAHAPFTTIPASNGSAYLGWVAGADVPSMPAGAADDFVISVEDGRGTQTDFISISETLKSFSDSKIATIPIAKRGVFLTIKRTLESGIQVVCFRSLTKK